MIKKKQTDYGQSPKGKGSIDNDHSDKNNLDVGDLPPPPSPPSHITNHNNQNMNGKYRQFLIKQLQNSRCDLVQCNVYNPGLYHSGKNFFCHRFFIIHALFFGSSKFSNPDKIY